MGNSLKDIWDSKNEKYDSKTLKTIERLPMTVGEIADNYRQSDKKAADIQRLSDLCACPKDIIEEIISKELGADQLPPKRGRKKKESIPVEQEKTVPAKPSEKKVKEKISPYIMDAVEDKMDQVNSQLQELTRKLFVLQQEKEDLERVYREFVEFMETHEVRESRERNYELCRNSSK